MRTLSVVTGGSRAMEYIWLVGKLDPLHGELGFQVPFKREPSTSSAQLISCQVESPMVYGSETAHYPDTNYGQTWWPLLPYLPGCLSDWLESCDHYNMLYMSSSVSLAWLVRPDDWGRSQLYVVHLGEVANIVMGCCFGLISPKVTKDKTDHQERKEIKVQLALKARRATRGTLVCYIWCIMLILYVFCEYMRMNVCFVS